MLNSCIECNLIGLKSPTYPSLHVTSSSLNQAPWLDERWYSSLNDCTIPVTTTPPVTLFYNNFDSAVNYCCFFLCCFFSAAVSLLLFLCCCFSADFLHCFLHSLFLYRLCKVMLILCKIFSFLAFRRTGTRDSYITQLRGSYQWI